MKITRKNKRIKNRRTLVKGHGRRKHTLKGGMLTLPQYMALHEYISSSTEKIKTSLSYFPNKIRDAAVSAFNIMIKMLESMNILTKTNIDKAEQLATENATENANKKDNTKK